MDICDIPYEHIVEELNVVHWHDVVVIFEELDSELGIVPRGLEGVRPRRHAERGSARHERHGERSCGVEQHFEQDGVVVVVPGTEDENEQDMLCHLCGRGDAVTSKETSFAAGTRLLRYEEMSAVLPRLVNWYWKLEFGWLPCRL